MKGEEKYEGKEKVTGKYITWGIDWTKDVGVHTQNGIVRDCDTYVVIRTMSKP